ncbi:hypothetical protein [Halococcus salsus]|uniref:hypothetical protein n=1 Tax=Halococcus salsus TaxID=2162894 RepID=UPI0013573D23|nr:hypothetical protein [Halococcus salsus]
MSWSQGLDWEEGEPQQSLKQDILGIFRANPDRIVAISDLRSTLFPDVSMPSDLNAAGAQEEKEGVILTTAKIEILTEMLVDEGQVDKREFDVDFAEQISVNEEEYDQFADALDGDVDQEWSFYRLSR